MTCFSLRIENNWVFVSRHRNRFDIRIGIRIELIAMMGSKLTRILLRGIEIDLVLASGSKLTCFLCGGQNRLRFCLRAENYLVLVYGSYLTWFLSWRSRLTWFLCAGRNDFFLVWGSLDLVFVRVVEIDLFFLCWSEITWS